MLESAIHSPIDMEHYTKEEDVFQLAANLAEKIMRNHAFQDGNKRTALVAADMFLKINGYYLQKVPFAEDKTTKSSRMLMSLLLPISGQLNSWEIITSL
jgi:death-on-curing family protein